MRKVVGVGILIVLFGGVFIVMANLIGFLPALIAVGITMCCVVSVALIVIAVHLITA